MPSDSRPEPNASRALPRSRAWIVGGVLAGSLLPALWLLNARTQAPSGLGVHDGRLAACPDSPNCIHSQSLDSRARVEPLPYTGPAKAALARLKAHLSGQPRIRLIQESPGYLRYEFRTRLCRFVDDVEFLADEKAAVLHVRSASRLGYSDLGANRARVEALREWWQRASPSPEAPVARP